MASKKNDDLRPEYDLSQLKGGVRGKYYKRAIAGTNLVLIEPDLAKAFPDAESVNRALRVLLHAARGGAAVKGETTIHRHTTRGGSAVKGETTIHRYTTRGGSAVKGQTTTYRHDVSLDAARGGSPTAKRRASSPGRGPA